MTTAYSWDVQVRLDPVNGDDETLDLMTAMSDASGPVSAIPSYPPSIARRETVSHGRDHYIRGFRPTVVLTFDVVTMGDQVNLQTVDNALGDQNVDVYLSLDGGATERKVVLIDSTGPTPLGGKTHVGARYVLTVEAANLIDKKPAIGSGTW